MSGSAGLSPLRPHLCVDTCSILDVMRDVTRKDYGTPDRKAALDLIAAVQAGVVRSWVASQVALEFDKHVDAVEAETEQSLDRLKSEVLAANDAVGLFRSSTNLVLDHFDGHARRSRNSAEQLIALSTQVAEGADVPVRAFDRVRHGIAPAARGKQSLEDCVVIETYLEHVRTLRATGDTAKVVFLSSNKADYCETGLALRHPLAEEFAALDMEFWPNFGAAKHALGL